MKKIVTSIVVSALACGVFAQTQTQTKAEEMEQLKTKVQEQVCTELKNLDEAVKAQIQAAKEATVQAQNQIREMKMSGKSDKEIEAKMNQIRNEAQQKLETAIQNMEQVQAQVAKASEEIQRRLQTKEGEALELKTQTRARDGSGDGKKGN